MPMRFSCLATLIIAASAGLSICGCDRSQVPPTTVQSAQAELDAAKEALAGGDFQTAETKFAAALSGGLNPDQLEAARVGRIQAWIGLERFDEAASGISELSQEAADMSEIHLLRYRLAMKQNDQTQADEALAEARKLNSQVKVPEIQ